MLKFIFRAPYHSVNLLVPLNDLMGQHLVFLMLFPSISESLEGAYVLC